MRRAGAGARGRVDLNGTPFAAEVQRLCETVARAHAVAPVGARTHWEVGGVPAPGVEVSAPRGIVAYDPAVAVDTVPVDLRHLRSFFCLCYVSNTGMARIGVGDPLPGEYPADHAPDRSPHELHEHHRQNQQHEADGK